MRPSAKNIAINVLTGVVLLVAFARSAFGHAPPPPTDLTATAPLDSQVALSWQAVRGAIGYHLYRSTTAGNETLLQTNIPGPTFEDSGLRHGQTYYYVVTAVNASGESGKTAEVSAVTKAAPPANLHANAGDSQVFLSWNASPTATGYRVYRDTLGGAGGATNFLVAGTRFTDTNLVNGTGYYYQIAAINVSGENFDTGTTVSATPAARNLAEAPVGAPANLTATAGNKMVQLHWLPVSNATTYDVFRGAGNHAESLRQTGLADTSCSDTGLTNGTPYYYRVRAVNAGQFTTLSDKVGSIPHGLASPTNLIAKAGNRQVVLTWTGDGTIYALYRGGASGAEKRLDAGLTGNTYTDAGAVNGTRYYYRIRFLDASGDSPLSAEVSAIPSGPEPTPWSAIVNFGLPGEPIQSCAAFIPDTNRPVQLALLSAEHTNLRSLAQKYNAITLALDGFTPFNFGTPSHPRYLHTMTDDHPVSIIDCRWPELSVRRILAALTAATQLVPSHPEIKNTGLVVYGFSEGVDNINLAVAQPALLNRVLAVVNMSEIDEDRYNPLVTMDSVPHLFLASGRPDIYSSLNLGLEDFSTVTHDAFSRGLATAQGAPLTVLNNAGARHGENSNHPFIRLWLDSVLSQRLPATVPVSMPVNLPSWQGAAAWVGSYDVVCNRAAPWNSGVQTINNVIAPKSLYSDPRPFTWLPSRNVAAAWLAYANSGRLTAFKPAL